MNGKPKIRKVGKLWICGSGKNGGVGWTPEQAYSKWWNNMRPDSFVEKGIFNFCKWIWSKE